MIFRVLNFLLYLFHSDRQFFYGLFGITGVSPGKLSVYKAAFIHKSASIVLGDGTRINNERLEYLGDAVLGAIVAEYIYKVFGTADEGFMTKLKSRIVKRKHLDLIAEQMGIQRMITSISSPANYSKHINGNALEALIGAIYIDRGYRCAYRFFFKKMLAPHIDIERLATKDSDYKSQLVEWSQKKKKYILFDSVAVERYGKNAPVFKSVVILDDDVVGTGHGDSKKEAEQQAAKMALKRISL